MAIIIQSNAHENTRKYLDIRSMKISTNFPRSIPVKMPSIVAGPIATKKIANATRRNIDAT